MTQLEAELIEPLTNSVTYDSYLKINDLLKLQKHLTSPAEHDEMLFIVIHQVYELWFKQILHEVEHCDACLRKDDVMAAYRTLRRVSTIQQTLTKQVDVLETMTPNDFNRFRSNLNPASGFQSFQFRLLEFRLGEKNLAYLKFHKNQPEHHTVLENVIGLPTLFDAVLGVIARRGFNIPKNVLDRNYAEIYMGDPTVTLVIAEIYKNCEKNYDLYLLLEALVDLDEYFLLWRYRHVAMVGRMIGQQRGTGGSSGVNYLEKTLSKRFFPDLWEARNHLHDSNTGKPGAY